MEHAYSVLMGIFATLLFLYGLLVTLTKDDKLIFRSYAAKMTDKKLYAKQFGKVIMIVATAPALSAFVALFGEKFIIPALIVLIAGITGGIVIGTRIMPNDDEPGSKDE